MAYNAQYALSPCPFCGNPAQYRSDRDGETYFYIASCEDMTCEGYNENTFDDQDACCKWWNNSVIEWKKQMDDESDDEEPSENSGEDVRVSAITAEREEGNYLITLRAVSENINENTVCAWTLIFNADNYVYMSVGPVYQMTNTQSVLFNAASIVKASVSVGGYTSETFTLKE